MTLDQLIEKLTAIREANSRAGNLPVDCEDSEMGIDFGNEITGVTVAADCVSIRITNLAPSD